MDIKCLLGPVTVILLIVNTVDCEKNSIVEMSYHFKANIFWHMFFIPKSVLMRFITSWYDSCSAQGKEALEKNTKAAQRFIGTLLSAI